MSAWVDETTRFEATCNSCSWWGPERYTPDKAEEDADMHDREKHPEVAQQSRPTHDGRDG